MITDDSELPDMVYYDKDIRKLESLIGSAYDTLRVIKSRHDMADDITISKSVFDYRLAQMYRSKHPDKLFRCVFDDITIVAVPSDGGYKVNVIGSKTLVDGCFVVSDSDYSFQTSSFKQINSLHFSHLK